VVVVVVVVQHLPLSGRRFHHTIAATTIATHLFIIIKIISRRAASGRTASRVKSTKI
jgi:hypothetical protein